MLTVCLVLFGVLLRSAQDTFEPCTDTLLHTGVISLVFELNNRVLLELLARGLISFAKPDFVLGLKTISFFDPNPVYFEADVFVLLLRSCSSQFSLSQMMQARTSLLQTSQHLTTMNQANIFLLASTFLLQAISTSKHHLNSNACKTVETTEGTGLVAWQLLQFPESCQRLGELWLCLI